jgi:hypothetical protein
MLEFVDPNELFKTRRDEILLLHHLADQQILSTILPM